MQGVRRGARGANPKQEMNTLVSALRGRGLEMTAHYFFSVIFGIASINQSDADSRRRTIQRTQSYPKLPSEIDVDRSANK